MTKENKEILLKDICGRLPYGVKVQIKNEIVVLDSICDDNGYYFNFIDGDREGVNIEQIKPYLFPLSSMTEEESNEFQQLDTECDKMPTFDYISIEHYRIFDWLNKNHFDYRGLIEKGLAIDATNLNVY